MTQLYKTNSFVVALLIGFCLFLIPFFWLKPGFVDMGGDAGRLYFFDPLSVAKNTQGPLVNALIPYEWYLSFMKVILQTPTNLISFERGVQLSLSFYSIFLIVQLLLLPLSKKGDELPGWAAIVAGVFYVGLITKLGWTLSLETHNQVFLNPLLFYFLLQLALTARFRYAWPILLLTLLYSGSFGFSAMPALTAFYPLTMLYLVILVTVVYKKIFPWRHFLLLALLFGVSHAFHIIPVLLTVFGAGSQTHTYVFTQASIQEAGVHYFDENHVSLGKISVELFQPSTWHHNVLVLIVPILTLFGLLKKRNIVSVITGILFAITLFFTSANITHIGVSFYRSLFYIPGFMMFRSFNEKWYFVYAFFYALLFGCSYWSVMNGKKRSVVIGGSVGILLLIGYLIFPFLQGKAIYQPHYQSKNVSAVFTMDPDLLSALTMIKSLPNGNVITLPLTFPYFQIAYGREGGAYVGVSMVKNIAGRQDYPGFWSLGDQAQPFFNAIQQQNNSEVLRILKKLDIRYVFYNSDSRIMDNFPDYPYIYPGLMYSSKEQLPAIRDQSAYQQFLKQLPLTTLYSKGFYTLYEIFY